MSHPAIASAILTGQVSGTCPFISQVPKSSTFIPPPPPQLVVNTVSAETPPIATMLDKTVDNFNDFMVVLYNGGSKGWKLNSFLLISRCNNSS
jgi:hypothetical protein